MNSLMNDNLHWAYLAGALDKKGFFCLFMRRGKTGLNAVFNLAFSCKKRALLYKGLFGGEVYTKVDTARVFPLKERSVYLLKLPYKVLDELLPKLQPFTLKKNIYFYLKFRSIKRAQKEPRTFMSDEERKLRFDLYNEWLEYARSAIENE